MDTVTVIIPYFKKKKFIKSTLKSVLNQSYNKIDIIIIYDDEDKSDLEYLRSLKKLDKRIDIIVNKKNLGVSKSRNLAINKSKGKYIGFIDSDDLWKKKKIEYQLKFMKQNKFLICHTDYEIINKKNKKLTIRKARNFYNVDQLLKSCDIGLSSVLLKKSILKSKNVFPNLKTKEDFVLWLKLLKKGYQIGSLNKNLMSWRKLHNSLSSSILQKLFDGFKVYNTYMKFNVIKSFYFLICLSLNFLKKQ